MQTQIIADSCCDTTPAIRAAANIVIAPLKITLNGNKEYLDDTTLDTAMLIADMKAAKGPVATACPSVDDYLQLMLKTDISYVVTLSSKLSGSHNSACVARDLALEKDPSKKIVIFDSKSASAGELRLAFFIDKLIHSGASFEEVSEKTFEFIEKMHTLFVLEDLSNLIKNGRIPKMAGMIGTLLMLRPIMCAENGEISALEKIRGTQKALDRLVEIIADITATVKEKSMDLVLSYCNCPERGIALKKKIIELCPAISKVTVVATGGLSTSYANDGGVVLAFG